MGAARSLFFDAMITLKGGSRGFLVGSLVLVGALTLTAQAGASSHDNAKTPIGIGSTLKQWAKAYGKDHGICEDCYGPGVNNADSGKTWLYSGVGTGPTHVVEAYSINVFRHTPWDVAQAYVLRMLPKDAVLSPAVGVTVEHDGSTTCGVFTATSATLAKEKAFTTPSVKVPTGDDPTGVVQVTLSVLDSNNNETYNAMNVQSVTVLAGQLSPAC
jgi:hypothetical protein